MPLQMEGVDTNQLLVAAQLRLTNGHQLMLVCLHLKAKPDFSQVREHQGRFLLDYIKSHSEDSHSVVVS